MDKRADIWAFGCVLYEMLSGRQVFGASDTVSERGAMLTREPDWSTLPASTPQRVRTLLQRCLQKDAARRLHHVADARIELEEHDTRFWHRPEAIRAGRAVTPSRWLLVATTALAVLASGSRRWAGWRLWTGDGRAAAAPQVTRLELNLPVGVELYTATSRTVAASPDGKSVAFVGTYGGTVRCTCDV